MPTARLIPSTYYLSNSSYLTVASANNMYANTDSTTVGTVTNTRTSTSSYYIYLRGFNFSAVPDDAIVSGIAIKLKAYHSGGNTSTIYCYDDTTQVSSCGSATALSESATVKEFTNVTVGWDTLKGYGSDFGIRINCRRSNRNTQAVIYIYGAEIDVTYTVPVYHSVTATGDGTLTPASETVLDGDSFTLHISDVTSPTVVDNNVDVTSQLIQTTEVTDTAIPDDNTNSGWYSVGGISNAYHDADNNTYADFELAGGGATGTVYLVLSDLGIPPDATIVSVSCSATLQYNRNGSSSGFSASCQMYAGNTAKGSATTVVSAGGTDVAKTTFNLTVGSWTVSEIENARFYLTATNNASSTRRHIYIYGVSFVVTYECDGVIYIYTIQSVTADHVIVVTAGASAVLFFKNGATWTAAQKAYKKVNGAWVAQADMTTVFDPTKNYVRG